MKKIILLITVISCSLIFAESTVANYQIQGDSNFFEMNYFEAISNYNLIAEIDIDDSLLQKKALSYLYLGDEANAAKIFNDISTESKNETRILEADYYLASLKLNSTNNIFANNESKFVFNTIAKMFSNTNTPETSKILIIDKLIDYYFYVENKISPAYLRDIAKLSKKYANSLSSDNNYNNSMILANKIAANYIVKNYSAGLDNSILYLENINSNLNEYTCKGLKYLSKNLFEYEKEQAMFINGVYFSVSPHALAARAYGLEYLDVQPYDTDFANWLGSEVCLNVFMQNNEKAFLMDAVVLAPISGHKILGFLENYKKLDYKVNKSEKFLLQDIFSSSFCDSEININLLNAEDQSLYADIKNSLIRNKDIAVPMVGLRLKNKLKPFLLGHSKKYKDKMFNKIFNKTILNHHWLSSKIFGNKLRDIHTQMIDVHRGKHHRLVGGHDVSWLIKNIKKLSKVKVGGKPIGKTKAIAAWCQHLGQDFFSKDGIPIPGLTKWTEKYAHNHAKLLIKQRKNMGKKYAEKVASRFMRRYGKRIASKTCINAAKVANVAMWVWIAYDTYQMYEDIRADINNANVQKQLDQIIYYEDFSGLNSIKDFIEQKIEIRKPEKSLEYKIFIGNLCAQNNEIKSASEIYNEVINEADNLTKEFSIDSKNKKAEKQDNHLTDMSDEIEEILIEDSGNNTKISCQGFVYECYSLITNQTKYAREAIGKYERIGDKLKKIEEPEYQWAAAINFYRAARLAVSTGNKKAKTLTKKAIEQLGEFREKDTIANILVEKLQANWASELSPEDVEAFIPDAEHLKNERPKKEKYLIISLENLILTKIYLKKKSNITISLLKKEGLNKEKEIFNKEYEDIIPGKKHNISAKFIVPVLPSSKFILRITKKGILKDEVIYDSNKYTINNAKGIKNLIGTFKSVEGFKIDAICKIGLLAKLNLLNYKLTKVTKSELKKYEYGFQIYTENMNNIFIAEETNDKIPTGINLNNPNLNTYPGYVIIDKEGNLKIGLRRMNKGLFDFINSNPKKSSVIGIYTCGVGILALNYLTDYDDNAIVSFDINDIENYLTTNKKERIYSTLTDYLDIKLKPIKLLNKIEKGENK